MRSIRPTRFVTRTLAFGAVATLAMTTLLLSSAESASASTHSATSVSVVSFVSTSGGSIISGARATLSGTTSSNLDGKTLSLQKLSGKKWVSLGITTRVSSSSTFARTFTVGSVGAAVKYRAHYAGSSHLKSSSGDITTTVSKWYSLYNQKLVSDGENYGWEHPDNYNDGFYLAGTYYSKAITPYGKLATGHTAWSEYNLSYKCSEYSVAMGVEDGSDSGSSADFTTQLDGTTSAGASGIVALGSAWSTTIDTEGAFRLHLEFSIVKGKARPLWANAEILCTGSPNPQP